MVNVMVFSKLRILDLPCFIAAIPVSHRKNVQHDLGG